jgi:putative hydrolase of the HAD superfamily
VKRTRRVTTLLLDIGGVLLTNGWDRESRDLAARRFGLDPDETRERHHLTFDTYEVGKLTLEQYLDRLVFYRKRPFTRAEFRAFMLGRSKPYPEMIELIRRVKARHGVKIAVVSNEGRELTEHRIRKFRLGEFIDFFITSCFVHIRKPDADIYRMALDVAQTPAAQALYIEDRALFVQVARGLGIRGIRHTDYAATRARLAAAGLWVRE